MNLTEPQYLWALLLLPLLWWLSQPPKPRKQVVSAHLAQWQLAMRALRRKPPRGSWLRFALLALALIAACIAAARPFQPAGQGPTKLVVLLDASASMAVTNGDQSAFARAVEQLRPDLDAVPEHVDVTVLRCGGDLLRRYGVAARELQDLGEPAGSLDADLVQLARELTTSECVAWTVTDGQGQTQLPEVGALTMLDTAGPNGVITAVRIVDAWPLPTLQLELDIEAHGSSQQIDASLHVQGAVLQPQTMRVELQRGRMQTHRLSLQRSKNGGNLTIELRVAGDRLQVDNWHTLRVPPLPAPRVAALADGDAGPFVSAAAGALAEEVGGEVVTMADGVAVGLLLVDGGFVALQKENGELEKRRVLTFGTRLSQDAEPQPWLLPSPVDWSRTSDLTRGLDLSELRIQRAWQNLLPAGEPFVWWVDGNRKVPLGVVVDHGETASVHLAFRLEDSNLPLLPAFPQLLRRAFVRSYGKAQTSIATPLVPPPGERDLMARAEADDRPLPAFADPEVVLTRWFVAVGLLALAFRAFVR